MLHMLKTTILYNGFNLINSQGSSYHYVFKSRLKSSLGSEQIASQNPADLHLQYFF